MLKVFKEHLLLQVLNLLKDKFNLDNSVKWKKNGNNCFIPLIKNTQISLFVYFGIRFIGDKDYVIPYLRVSSIELKIVNDDECLIGFNVSDKVNYECLDLTLNKCNFDDNENVTVEILQLPPSQIIERLKFNNFNRDSLKKFDITNLELSSQNIRSWDMFTEIFSEKDINSEELSIIVNPVVNDIERILSNFYMPYIENLLKNKQ